MLIRIVRQGGFTGIPKTMNVDTAKLSPEKAALVRDALEQLVDSVSESCASGAGCDRFSYLISYDDEDGRSRQIQRAERTAQPLLAAVA
jgi:hypothetical protein